MKLIIDSTLDIKDEDVTVIPLVTTLDEKVIDLTKDEFYLKLKEKKTIKTSQPAPAEFVEVFNKVKENNDKALVLTLSSKLSGTYQSASLAKQIVDYDDIYLYDTQSTSIGSIPLYNLAKELISKNTSIEEIIKQLDELKQRITLRILPSTLEYLYLGGRLSKTKYFMANLLLIKPVITVIDGVVEIAYKSRGFKKGIQDILKEVDSSVIEENSTIYLGYTDNIELLNDIKTSLQEKYPNSDIVTIQIGTVVGTHVGPEGIGVTFIKKNK